MVDNNRFQKTCIRTHEDLYLHPDNSKTTQNNYRSVCNMKPMNKLHKVQKVRKRLVRTVLIFTESSDQLSRATDRVPGLPASPGYVQ